MIRKTMAALRLVAVVACLGCAATVGSLTVKGDAPHWLKLCGLAALMAIRPIMGDARYAAIRAVAK